MKQKAFTLAEIMIVLSVIGVLTAILLPSAWHSAPNENVMKFKKAHNTLYRVINELVTSDKYFKDGDLGIRSGGTQLSLKAHKKYLCEVFADVLSIKEAVCSQAGSDYLEF